MKIGIDARMYGKITGGIGRYIKELISQLEKLDSQNEYVIFLYSKNFDEYIPTSPNFTKILAPWRWYTFKEQTYFLNLINKYNFDLMHFPHFNVPFFYNKPFIITIHDLILIKDSQEKATTLGKTKYKIKKYFYNKIIRNAIFNSKQIITLTNYGKADIINTFSTPQTQQNLSQKISVIPQGISLTLTLSLTSTLQKINTNYLDTKINLRYNINKPYLLYVGNAYPHKNLEKLLDVFYQISLQHNIELVLVGREDFFYKRLLQKNKSTKIKYLGFIEDTELQNLYKNAFAYIFPSRYEGFGLPPLEAMLFGCPVLCSNTSCLPEVLGDSAIYFNPHSTQEIQNAILQLLTNPNLKTKLQKAGFERIKLYNWQTTAQQTLNIYNKFSNSPSLSAPPKVDCGTYNETKS